MNTPNPRFDQQKLHELASAAMDGTANEGQLIELTELLRESPKARDEYLAIADLHATLATEIADPSSTLESSTAEPVATHRRNRISIVAVAAVAAVAASLLLTVGWFTANDSDATPNSFATIAQATQAVWESDAIQIDDRIGTMTMRLKSGLVRVDFDSGVEVTLEGPAVFKLVDVARAELTSGVLTATVPPGAEGFAVNTPSAQVIDLGTSFGIDLRNDGFSDVSVFDGEVEIATRNTTQPDLIAKRLLSEGESVRIGRDQEVLDISFDPMPFEKIWPFASGIVGSTKTIDFVPPWPRRIRFVQSDDKIFVRPEGHRVRLEDELMTNISEPGDCFRLDDLSPDVIEIGETVRSYLLHFSPETQLGPRLAGRVSGSITFDRTVLGVIVRHEELLASSQQFGPRRAGEGNQRRELSFTGDDTGDRITLSEDRKTVSLDLISPGRSSDLVRVIVESSRGVPSLSRTKNQLASSSYPED